MVCKGRAPNICKIKRRGEDLVSGEKMQASEEEAAWRKAIPEARDRLQSRVLVWVVGALLTWETAIVLQQVYFLWGTDRAGELLILAKVTGISVAFACLVVVLHAATLAGAAFGGAICLILLNGTASSQYTVVRSGLVPLALLFVLTFLSTRAGRAKKARAGLAESRRGRRASQVIANLATAALSVSSLGFVFVTGGQVCCGAGHHKQWIFPAMMGMCLAAMVEATADTVSSEIGQAFGGKPIMLLSLKPVEPGTDGAVTVLGSAAGIVAGAVVAVTGIWGLKLQVEVAAIAFGAGICGLFFDSLLGGTMERRGWIGNDVVNFASTLVAALLAAGVYRFLAL